MFNSNLLRAKLIEKGVSVIEICKEINVCEATYYRKIARNGDFSRCEIQAIADILSLSNDEKNEIFFAQ